MTQNRLTKPGWKGWIGPILLLCVAGVLEGRADDQHRLKAAGTIATDSRRIQESLEEHVANMFATMSPSARRGYEFLTQKVYLPPDFNEEIMEELDANAHQFPFESDPQSTDFANATRPAWRAYGLSPRPDDKHRPLQYVVTRDGQYVMNCFACHGGNTYGVSFPGAPNTTYALESLVESVRLAKVKLKIPFSHMDLGSIFMPLGKNVGTSNAVMFGVALMNFRDPELNVVARPPASMVHHDMDAPPWWHFSRKSHLYIDGFTQKGHKALMQFMLVRQNGPDRFREWSKDFEDVFAFLESVSPPKYPLDIDSALASRGEAVYRRHCAQCHGDAKDRGSYPELNVPIDEIGTDRVRWESLTRESRSKYHESWFADFGAHDTILEPAGYTAPPLDGIWASAPYFHNGSVPTLWHVLHPDQRPTVWRRTALELDTRRIGLTIESMDAIPGELPPNQRRWYFDTRGVGKSASGHDYPSSLSEQEKQELLEFLKTR